MKKEIKESWQYNISIPITKSSVGLLNRIKKEVDDWKRGNDKLIEKAIAEKLKSN